MHTIRPGYQIIILKKRTKAFKYITDQKVTPADPSKKNREETQLETSTGDKPVQRPQMTSTSPHLHKKIEKRNLLKRRFSDVPTSFLTSTS